MSERHAFGPSLRRARLQRGISLDQVAAATKISADLWSGLEENDLSRWPGGLYARAYIRAYAVEIGIDPEATVDEFCRCFPVGDRRAGRIVREQAALIGHESTWRDDLAGVDADRRAEPAIADRVPLAFRRGGRVLAACGDLCAVFVLSTAGALLLPVKWTVSAIVCTLLYHTVSLVVLGSTPTVWAIDTHLALRRPSERRAQKARLLRLPGGSEPRKA